MKERLKSIRAKVEDFLKTDRGQIVSKLFRYGVQVLVIGILIWQIWNIGLMSVLSDLPTHPLFYLLFLLIYFTLPIAEFFTYRRSVPLKFWSSQSIFLRKRIYNKTIVGYSGELQLFFWLKKQFGIPEKQSFRIVRDNNTLSTIASTFVTITLLLGFFLTGNITLLESLQINLPLYLGAVFVGVVIISIVIWKFKDYVYNLNLKDTLVISGIHAGRLYLLAVLQVFQWHVVMPEVELQIWITIIAMQILLSRIPFVPNKDLVFIAVSLEYSQYAAISASGLAGLLLVNHILDKVLNAGLFAWLSWKDKKGGKVD